MQIAPLVRPVGLRQRAFGVDPVLKVFCDTGKLARVVGHRRLEQARLGLAHGTGAQMVGSPGDHRHVLIAEVTASKRLSGPGQLLQLPGDPDPFGCGTARQLASPLQPGDDGERAVGGIFAGIIEPAEPVGEDRLARVDARFPDLDQTLAQLLAIGLADPVRHRVDAIPKLRDNGLQRGLRARPLCYGGDHVAHPGARLRQLYVAIP